MPSIQRLLQEIFTPCNYLHFISDNGFISLAVKIHGTVILSFLSNISYKLLFRIIPLNSDLSRLIKFETIVNAICDASGLYFIPSSVVDPVNHQIIGIYDNSGNAWISSICIANGMYGVRYVSYDGTNLSSVSANIIIAYVHK